MYHDTYRQSIVFSKPYYCTTSYCNIPYTMQSTVTTLRLVLDVGVKVDLHLISANEVCLVVVRSKADTKRK